MQYDYAAGKAAQFTPTFQNIKGAIGLTTLPCDMRNQDGWI